MPVGGLLEGVGDLKNTRLLKGWATALICLHHSSVSSRWVIITQAGAKVSNKTQLGY